jgi:TP53 regulating kinase-like protein
MELIKQGAEAKVYKTMHNNLPAILKERLVKTYRIPELDKKLTKARIKQEARCLKVCKENGVATPEVYRVDKDTTGTLRTIIMEFIPGPSLHDFIDANINDKRDEVTDLAKQLGRILTKIHGLNMVHGDLTTSNIIVDTSCTPSRLVMIDFGLASTTTSVEDKAVDLYVLERAFSSTHPNTEDIVS